jgi:hypothetical protein
VDLVDAPGTTMPFRHGSSFVVFQGLRFRNSFFGFDYRQNFFCIDYNAFMFFNPTRFWQYAVFAGLSLSIPGNAAMIFFRWQSLCWYALSISRCYQNLLSLLFRSSIRICPIGLESAGIHQIDLLSSFGASSAFLSPDSADHVSRSRF